MNCIGPVRLNWFQFVFFVTQGLFTPCSVTVVLGSKPENAVLLTREIGDLLEVYRFLNGIDRVYPSHCFTFSTKSRARGQIEAE